MVKKKYLRLIGIACFVGILVLIPWEWLRGGDFPDKQVYIAYFAGDANALGSQRFDTVLGYILNEFAWHHAMLFLTRDVGAPIEVVLFFISALTLSVMAAIVARTLGTGYLLLLINPLVIDLCFSQYRTALAMSLVGIAYLLGRRWTSGFLLGAAPIVHTGSLIFMAVGAGAAVNKRYLATKCSSHWGALAAAVAIGATVSLLVGPFKEPILSYLGDRRAGDQVLPSSLGYSLFWLGLLGIVVLQRRGFFRSSQNLYTTSILSIVAFNTLSAGYSTRFLAVSLPLIVLSIGSLSWAYRVTALSA